MTASRVPVTVAFLMIAATVSWRPDSLYSGGVDPVVAAKGLLGSLALAIAWSARQGCARPNVLGNRTMWLALAYVVTSVFGAWAAGSVFASAVLGIRVLMLGATVVLMMRVFDGVVLLRALVVASASVAFVAAVTGVPTYLGQGRLGGGIPPLNPNELATLAALPLVWLAWVIFRGEGTTKHLWGAGALLAALWMTGSRTALLGVIVALVVMIVQARRLTPSVAFGLVCSAVALVYVATMTGLLGGFFARGGAENLTSLSSRTIAWNAAIDFAQNDWMRWVGVGMSTKEIPVAGQYWDTQLLDSSWMSAVVQAGYVGVVVLAVWVLSTVFSARRRTQPERMLLTGMLTLLVLRSILESGLMDSTPAFIGFFVASVLSDRVTGNEDARAGSVVAAHDGIVERAEQRPVEGPVGLTVGHSAPDLIHPVLPRRQFD